MEFARIENGVIVAVVDTDSAEKLGAGDWHPLPADSHARTGAKRAMFDENWLTRPMSELHAEGLLELDPKQKFEDGAIKDKTEYELVQDGLRDLEPDEYLDHENKEVVWGDTETLYANGRLTENQYQERKQTELEEWRQTAEVTRFQAKAALLHLGHLDIVQAYMNSDQATPLEKLAWAEAKFTRRSQLVNTLGQSLLGLTEVQIDDLFLLADNIEA
ncbi:hypothetical protein NFC81_09075 [Salinispirillum sp. LH 10-3-1]|uniref:Tail fiber assembly protein n=1 Tax=Salinispirillum sp. LH 10-3-1 TaxID=2952525 RepID=A0AB38YC61_9GAMM